ncbi:MAG: hypothetical protein ACNA8W_17640 [Bradymonadaceae bacterium]
MNENIKSPPLSTMRSKERLYPLFAIGFGFVAIGLYLGVQADTTPPPEIGRPIVEKPLAFVVPLDAVETEDLKPRNFRYHPETSGAYQVVFRQGNRYRDAAGVERSIETRLSFELHEVGVDSLDEQDRIRLDRTFNDVKVDSLEDGRRVGPEITRQLEYLVEDTRQAVWITDRGQVQEQEWISDTNPQIQQTLFLIHDGLTILQPHLRFDPVLIGETWTYRVDGRLLEGLEGGEVDGAVELVIHNRFEGVVETSSGELAMISQSLELRFKGEVGRDKMGFESSGAGKGLVLFDLERGGVAASRLTMNRVTEMDEADAAMASEVDLLFVRDGAGLGEYLK